jgi:hypothetical protein
METYRISSTHGPEGGRNELVSIIKNTQSELSIVCSDYSKIISLVSLNSRNSIESLKQVLGYYNGKIDLLLYADEDLKKQIKKIKLIELIGQHDNTQLKFLPINPKIVYLISDKRTTAIEDLSKDYGDLNVFKDDPKIANEWMAKFEEMKKLAISYKFQNKKYNKIGTIKQPINRNL